MKICSVCSVELTDTHGGKKMKCDDCQKIYMREYNIKNKAKLLEKQREYCKKNKEEISVKMKEYSAKNSEKNKIYQKEYNKKNKDKARVWYLNNKDKVNIKNKQWRDNNIDKCKWYRQQPYEKERRRLQSMKRRCLKKTTSDGSITVDSMRELLIKQDNKCFHCGCDLDFNTLRAVHIDHLQPVSKGGKHVLSNVVYSCGFCNMSKGARF